MMGSIIKSILLIKISYSKVKYLLIQYDVFYQKEMIDCQINLFVCIKRNPLLIKQMLTDSDSVGLYDSLIKMLYLHAEIFRQQWRVL